MTDWLILTVLILACYRLSRLIAIDEGPGGVFLKLREWGGAYDYGPNGQARTNFGRGIACPYCVGVWMAALLVLWLPLKPVSILYWLAVAGGQSFLWSLRNDGE